MRVVLHVLGSILVLPYAALALWFLVIGDIARSKGLFAVLETALNHLNGVLLWGIYLLPLLWLGLVVMGCVPRLQQPGALCLALLALASCLVVVSLSSTPVGLDDLVLLFPCLAVAVSSAWSFWRAGSRM
ncbi:hypothetical protein CPCC7001_196 [Cyanobium sp. PCC 7001]|uniref:hypothetical protein n=1 Tax=Cyanobium sp. PCC 7001 TaxID=180281 RepID=UPI0001804999|nr:hypothetical protein [Cyanobium sp. PCC 7001]EDY37318.1 hypothetical protein CPCC7001_196 [Cyanobium sp. PCC 7001]